ncbi:hypothetical protein [Methylacidimicrobium tartarophylax]|uniref:Uncharacterized protein n=1 Tax=Methylacidimicrobium tartarophylax TaxID=1041768 RepID=A0A5E6MG03_9BACT|nr:hypothetical protein [Methylacidimicrobium tartarophylax]VVM07280.1 hypothetical protein MAMT_01649 [Methylacidimicrobium tartarophylax]
MSVHLPEAAEKLSPIGGRLSVALAVGGIFFWIAVGFLDLILRAVDNHTELTSEFLGLCAVTGFMLNASGALVGVLALSQGKTSKVVSSIGVAVNALLALVVLAFIPLF